MDRCEASGRLDSAPIQSPEECAAFWTEPREAIEAIKEGLAEAEAGLGIPYRGFLRRFGPGGTHRMRSEHQPTRHARLERLFSLARYGTVVHNSGT